jgi:hypothetical protein
MDPTDNKIAFITQPNNNICDRSSTSLSQLQD